jgi:RNase H-like domain found in reverse transcriptase
VLLHSNPSAKKLVNTFNFKLTTPGCGSPCEEARFIKYTLNRVGLTDESLIDLRSSITEQQKIFKQFLGLPQSKQVFFNEYAIMTTCLLNLLKEHVNFKLTPERLQALQTMKEAFIKTALFAQPNFTKQFQVDAEVSSYVVGSTISQQYDDKQAPQIISYYSKGLTHPQLDLTTDEYIAIVIKILPSPLHADC